MTLPPRSGKWPAARHGIVAERWILGMLLVEPHRWHDVQVDVQSEDFTDARHRRIAEVYWNYQRDEGEPVFNEFLGCLDEDPDLAELAVELRRRN